MTVPSCRDTGSCRGSRSRACRPRCRAEPRTAAV